MDGENNGKPYLKSIKMDDLGVPPFMETPTSQHPSHLNILATAASTESADAMKESAESAEALRGLMVSKFLWPGWLPSTKLTYGWNSKNSGKTSKWMVKIMENPIF